MERQQHYCPWYLAYTFDHRLRRLFQKPEIILAPYVKEGMTALDLGCGMGFYSIALAKMVGATGRVISLDIQEKMLSVLRARAEKAGVISRIATQLIPADGFTLQEKVDFAIAMWMVHETPDKGKFLMQVRACLKPDAKFLIAEPVMHIDGPAFDKTVALAEASGYRVIERPKVGLSRAVVLRPA